MPGFLFCPPSFRDARSAGPESITTAFSWISPDGDRAVPDSRCRLQRDRRSGPSSARLVIEIGREGSPPPGGIVVVMQTLRGPPHVVVAPPTSPGALTAGTPRPPT